MMTNTVVRKHKPRVVNICLILVLLLSSLNASNYVTVATIGTRVPVIDQKDDMQEVVDKVKEFWIAQLEQVLPYNPDLIVLPEVCDQPIGFSKEELSIYYQVRQDQIFTLFSEIANDNNCYIAFGTKRKEKDGKWRNSVIMYDRNGGVAGIYNKNYPTIKEMEKGIVPGDTYPLFQCDFGTVAGIICFDLNFTELCDKYAAQKPDIIVFPSAYHGGIMQSHWAYQCRSFFIGSLNPRNVPSEIRNPLGDIIATSTNYFDFAVSTINLDNQVVHLDYNWDKLIALKARYGEDIVISDPGKLGAVMVTSENENMSIDEMVDEFDLELLDDYFDRSRRFRGKKLMGAQLK